VSRLRLVSFDLWSTLTVGSEAYKRRRAELAARAFDRPDLDAVRSAIDAADAELDELTELTGHQYGFAERIGRTRELLGAAELPADIFGTLRAEMGRAFARHLPTLTEPTLPETLAGLRHLGLRIAITSNTGYVPGRLLRPVLDRLGILRLTDHLVFSDEVGYAKPSPRIFRQLANGAGGGPAETLHVGDNRRADYEGALAAGLHALWYRPRGEPAPGVLLGHRDLLDHPLVRAGGRESQAPAGPSPPRR
jgi:HAD superfamily hydrolase (TIGR01509 family)